MSAKKPKTFQKVWSSYDSKRQKLGFVIKNQCSIAIAMSGVSIVYWVEENYLIGVANSEKPLLYSKWKTLFPNAEFYADFGSASKWRDGISGSSSTSLLSSVAAKHNKENHSVNVRDCFNLALLQYK